MTKSIFSKTLGQIRVRSGKKANVWQMKWSIVVKWTTATSFPKISLLKVESVESAVGNVLRNGKATC